MSILMNVIQNVASQNVGEYEFTSDWFSGREPMWDQIIEMIKPTRILEIGSYEGRSTSYLIERCGNYADIEITCIDTWEGGVEHNRNDMGHVESRFDKNVEIAKKHSKKKAIVKKIKNISRTGLIYLSNNQQTKFDLIYIDGSHQAPDVLTDAIMSFYLLRKNGIMIFDDYLWHMEALGNQDILNMPKLAIDAFTNIFQRKLQILSGMPLYQLFIQKTVD